MIITNYSKSMLKKYLLLEALILLILIAVYPFQGVIAVATAFGLPFGLYLLFATYLAEFVAIFGISLVFYRKNKKSGISWIKNFITSCIVFITPFILVLGFYSLIKLRDELGQKQLVEDLVEESNYMENAVEFNDFRLTVLDDEQSPRYVDGELRFKITLKKPVKVSILMNRFRGYFFIDGDKKIESVNDIISGHSLWLRRENEENFREKQYSDKNSLEAGFYEIKREISIDRLELNSFSRGLQLLINRKVTLPIDRKDKSRMQPEGNFRWIQVDYFPVRYEESH